MQLKIIKQEISHSFIFRPTHILWYQKKKERLRQLTSTWLNLKWLSLSERILKRILINT